MIRVLLVDDQELVRRGFSMIIGVEADIEVVGEAGDGQQALEAVERLSPDVVLMDVQMPGLDGLAATEAVLADSPRTRVIILTTFERDDYIFGALRRGASGFLLKNSPPEELVAAIRVVAAGDALLSPAVTRRVIGSLASGSAVAEPWPELDRLTDREREVLVLVATGLSNSEIGERLYIGEATVKTHVSNVLSKLQLRDRVQAVVAAYRHGLIDPRV